MPFIYEYIWLDSSQNFRSKIRVSPNCLLNEELEWNYDGTSTGQAEIEHSEILLKPVAIYSNPFLKKEHSSPHDCMIVLCESIIEHNGLSAFGSNYQLAKKIFDNPIVKENEIWFGLEQEYFFIDPKTNLPFGFGISFEDGNIFNTQPIQPQGPYYCGIGANHIICRNIAEEHLMICIQMGLSISGMNFEVAYSQCEYQIGPVMGIEAANQLWVSRYILHKIAEKHHVNISFHPKPIQSVEWNGSGCHTNVSTKYMRNGTQHQNYSGMEYILEAIEKLEHHHQHHMNLYGEYNHLRLTGLNETANMNTFSYGVGTRNTSIRIGNKVRREGKGYFEDRRPASNCDPYLVTSVIAETILL